MRVRRWEKQVFVCVRQSNNLSVMERIMGDVCVCMKVKPGVCISAVTLLLFNLCCVRFGVW